MGALAHASLLMVLSIFGRLAAVKAVTQVDAANCLTGSACYGVPLPSCAQANVGRFCTGNEVANALANNLDTIVFGQCCYIQDTAQLVTTCARIPAQYSACRQCLECQTHLPPSTVPTPVVPVAPVQTKPPCTPFHGKGVYYYHKGDCIDCCSNGCDNCACTSGSGSCEGKQSAINAACAEATTSLQNAANVQQFMSKFSNFQNLQTSGGYGGVNGINGALAYAQASQGHSTTVYDGHHTVVLGACEGVANSFECHTNNHETCIGNSFTGRVCSSPGRTGDQTINVEYSFTMFDPNKCGA